MFYSQLTNTTTENFSISYNYILEGGYRFPIGKFKIYYNFTFDSLTDSFNGIYSLDHDHHYKPSSYTLPEHVYDISTGIVYKIIECNATENYMIVQDSVEYEHENELTLIKSDE